MIRKKRNYENLLLAITVFFGFLTYTQAQTISVQGKVTSKEDGLPLPGVSILVEGTQNATQSDFNGDYNLLKVSKNSFILVSYVGMKKQRINVTDKSVVNISMVSNLQGLDEVVVIGYGTSKKSELTESVSTMKNTELMKSTGVSLEQAMQGKMSGVKINASQGGPGAGFSISVRGTSSINGTNEPLYVIDGVPIVKDNVAGGSGGVYSSLPLDPLAGINPSDVQSIEVLKDASATAIYGSRGANGVVLITTKQGKEGKLSVTYDTSFGIESISNKLDLLNAGEYYKYRYLKSPNDPLFTDVNNPFYINPNDINNTIPGVDWQDEVYRQAFMQNHQVGFKGGSKNTNFFASLGYVDQEGLIIGSNFNRYNGLVNLNVIADKFRMNTSMNFSQSVQEGSIYASGGPNNDFAGVVSKIFISRPLGSRDSVNSTDFESGSDEETDYFQNPYLFATEVTNTNKQARITGNINAFYEIAKHFEVQARIGGSLTFNDTDRYFPKETTAAGRRLNGYAQILKTDVSQFNFDNLLHYKNSWKKHSLNAMVGYTLENGSRNVLNVQNQGFVYDNTGVNNIGVGTDLLAPNNSIIDYTLNSYLSRLNYNYDGKYLLTFTGRVDGSSKFPTGNKYAFFPSGAFAWNLHKENFMENANWINNFRIRYSIGMSGNQAIPSYQSLGLLNDVNYSFGGGLQTGLVFSQLENKDLKWETTTQNNIGLDLGFFNNRISLTADAFLKTTTDVLLAIPVSSTVGVDGNPYQNGGEIENKGLELSLNTKNFNREKFSWDTNFNISFYKNTIKSLGKINEFYASFGPDGQFTDIISYRNGGQIGEFYGYKTDGVVKTQEELDSSPKYSNSQIGGWKIKDVNGDGKIDASDRTVIGSNQPKYFGGILNTFKVKNFDLSFSFEFSVGQDVYNANNYVLLNTQDNYNKLTSILNDSFVAPSYDTGGSLISNGNPNGTLPAIGSNTFFSPIDAFVEDASYLRLQNITVGYIIPVAKKINISRLRIYMSANNLLLFTKYTGYDPDVNTTRNNGLIRGVDFGSYPRSRNFIWGLNVTL